MYLIEYARRAERELERLARRIPRSDYEAILHSIRELSRHPRLQSTTKLVGEEDSYRLWAGQYRIVYQVDDASQRVIVTRVGRRWENAYRCRDLVVENSTLAKGAHGRY